MALGRLGDGKAITALLQAHSTEMDPFLSHAITYALYEIGDLESLPEKHPLAKQVLLMRKRTSGAFGPMPIQKSFREMEKTRSRKAGPAGATSRCAVGLPAKRRRRAWGKAVQ